jgi:hypothetical protein
METAVQEWEDQLPPWAIRKAQWNVLEIGAQLRTRDGRRCGNAHIIGIKASVHDVGRDYYQLITDAGTRIVMNSTEILGAFWPPEWISDVADVLRKFDREPEPQ